MKGTKNSQSNVKKNDKLLKNVREPIKCMRHKRSKQKYVSSTKSLGLSFLFIRQLERTQKNKSPHITSCSSTSITKREIRRPEFYSALFCTFVITKVITWLELG